MALYTEELNDLLNGLGEGFGSRVSRTDAEGSHLVVRVGDAFFSVRVRDSPVAEVFVQLRPLDGFHLAVKWRREVFVNETTFERAFMVDTNDDGLARAFLDEPARAALLASVYSYQPVDDIGGERRRSWTYEIDGDTLVATKGASEYDARAASVAVACACTIAARVQRWAADPWAGLARSLLGTAATEVALGEPLITATRHGIDASVALARRRRGDRARLHTRIAAARHNGDGETLSVVDSAAGNGFRPHVPAGGKRAVTDTGSYIVRASTADMVGRVDDLAKRLLAIARPVATVVDLATVELVLDGICDDRERLDAGLELVTRWAVDRGLDAGPYR